MNPSIMVFTIWDSIPAYVLGHSLQKLASPARCQFCYASRFGD